MDIVTDHCDFRFVRRSRSEREAQADGEKNREDESPEDRFGLANEFAEPDECELDDRAVHEPAASFQSSRSVLPVSATNTSSSVAEVARGGGAGIDEPIESISSWGVPCAMMSPVIDDRHAIAEFSASSM